MSDSSPSAAARLDSQAVDRALRRLAASSQAPWLHVEVARRMALRLELIRLKPVLLIDWWGAIGAGSLHLQRAYPQARHIVVEPTPALAARSRAALPRRWWTMRHWRDPANVVVTDLATLPADAELVWANMMLHAVADPPTLFETWQRTLRVEGFVMFSCLGPGSLRELRALYQRLGWSAPTTPFVDMHDLGDMLVHAGFADPVMDQDLLSLRWDSAQALLDELRSLGGNAAPDRFAGLRTPRWRARLLHEIESLRGPDGKIGLSFEIVFGHAFKARPRVRPGEQTLVSLQDMRSMVGLGRRHD